MTTYNCNYHLASCSPSFTQPTLYLLFNLLFEVANYVIQAVALFSVYVAADIS